jgi:LacI family transcriptional regulator
MKATDSPSILLSDVARAASVSTATVSLVLRDRGRISPETRNRVRKVVEEMGYRPNLAASMLARETHESSLPSVPVAMLGSGIKNHYRFHGGFTRHFTRHATELGFIVHEPEQADYGNITSLFRILYSRGVRGIVLNYSFESRHLTVKDAWPFSFIFCGQPLLEHRFNRVSTEVFETVKYLWETAWNRGYRRIGAALCRHEQEILDDFSREAAFLACEARHGLDPVPMFTGAHGDDDGFIRWVREVRPDAVVSFKSGFYFRLCEAGFKVPKDIGFASLHVGENENVITGYYEDFEELARLAAIQLDTMIRHNQTGFPAHPHATHVFPVFHEGSTLPIRPVTPPKKRRVKSR